MSIRGYETHRHHTPTGYTVAMTCPRTCVDATLCGRATMQHKTASANQNGNDVPENYIAPLFHRFKESHFEHMLVIAFARDLDLIPLILSDQLPKGQRKFSESDARDFLGRFDKKALNISFALAKNEIVSRGRDAPALSHYESALRDLTNEVSKSVGERSQASEEQATAATTVKGGEAVAAPPASTPSAVSPDTPQGAAVFLCHLCVSPMWQAIFPLPVLLGWMGGIPAGPLLAMSLITSVAFVLSHSTPGWTAGLMLGVLGNLLNGVTVVPIALLDRQEMCFPVLLHAAALPHWLNAGLWGVMCNIACHTLYNVLILVARSPLGSMFPGWMRHLPLASSKKI